MFGHSRPYKVQIDYLSPSEPKRFKQWVPFGINSSLLLIYLIDLNIIIGISTQPPVIKFKNCRGLLLLIPDLKYFCVRRCCGVLIILYCSVVAIVMFVIFSFFRWFLGLATTAWWRLKEEGGVWWRPFLRGKKSLLIDLHFHFIVSASNITVSLQCNKNSDYS